MLPILYHRHSASPTTRGGRGLHRFARSIWGCPAPGQHRTHDRFRHPFRASHTPRASPRVRHRRGADRRARRRAGRDLPTRGERARVRSGRRVGNIGAGGPRRHRRFRRLRFLDLARSPADPCDLAVPRPAHSVQGRAPRHRRARRTRRHGRRCRTGHRELRRHGRRPWSRGDRPRRRSRERDRTGCGLGGAGRSSVRGRRDRHRHAGRALHGRLRALRGARARRVRVALPVPRRVAAGRAVAVAVIPDLSSGRAQARGCAVR